MENQVINDKPFGKFIKLNPWITNFNIKEKKFTFISQSLSMGKWQWILHFSLVVNIIKFLIKIHI